MVITEAYYKLLYDVLRAYNRCTPSKVLRLRHKQIFVFGTDTNGSQRYGAAGLAAKNFGAQIGVRNGRTGDSYALPTMGCTLEELAVLDLIKKNPSVKQTELAEQTGKSVRSIKRIIDSLKEKQYIHRVDGKRYGKWEVLV